MVRAIRGSHRGIYLAPVPLLCLMELLESQFADGLKAHVLGSELAGIRMLYGAYIYQLTGLAP